MAMIDYGALLRVDGKFINKNKDMFMDASDTGYVAKNIIDTDGVPRDVDGNYFVYAGDEHFCVAFYKGIYKVISDGKTIYAAWEMPFASEIHLFEGLPTLKVSRLSKDFEIERVGRGETWEEYVKENWAGATGKEHISELKDGKKYFKLFRKSLKRYAYLNRHGGLGKERPYRFLAEWEYKGKKYEVIFGSGIENDEHIWNKTKNKAYGFRDEEIKLIDSWFLNQ